MGRWIERGVLVALMLAAPLDARAQDGAPEPGVGAFDVGRRAFDEGRFEDALGAFRRSHALLPSPNSRLMAARSLSALGRSVEAREELWRAQAEAAARVEAEPRYRNALVAAETESAELDAVLARVRLQVQGAGGAYVIRANGRGVDPDALGGIFWVEPGRTEIEVASPDGRTVSATLDAQAGQVHEVSLTLPPAVVQPTAPPAPILAPSPAEPSPARVSPFAPIGWVALGLGAASLVTFGGFYAATDAQLAELTRRCASMPCTEADAGDGPTFALLTNVFFVSSLVLIPLGVAALVAAQLDVGSVTLAIGPGVAHVRVLF